MALHKPDIRALVSRRVLGNVLQGRRDRDEGGGKLVFPVCNIARARRVPDGGLTNVWLTGSEDCEKLPTTTLSALFETFFPLLMLLLS